MIFTSVYLLEARLSFLYCSFSPEADISQSHYSSWAKTSIYRKHNAGTANINKYVYKFAWQTINWRVSIDQSQLPSELLILCLDFYVIKCNKVNFKYLPNTANLLKKKKIVVITEVLYN